MSTPFNLTRDVNGYNGFGLVFGDEDYASTLAANVEQTLTVPELVTGSYPRTFSPAKWIAVFSYQPGATVWVSVNATATVAGASFAATDSQLNPSARMVDAGDTLHFITADLTVIMGVSFYALF